MIKRRFQSYCKAIIVAIVALVFALAGFMLVPRTTANAAGSAASITISAASSDGGAYVVKGGSIDLSIRVHNEGMTGTWDAINLYIYSDNAQYLSLPADETARAVYHDGFADATRYDASCVDDFVAYGCFMISVSANIGKEESVSTDFVAEVKVNVSDSLPDTVNSIGFYLNPSFEETSILCGEDEYVYSDRAGFVGIISSNITPDSPGSVTVSKALSGANISGINVGSSAGSLVAATGSGSNYSCSSTVKSKDFYVLPVIETASSGNAKWTVNGTAGMGTTPVKVTLGNGASTEITVVVTPEDGNTANNKTYKLTVNHEFPRLSNITFNVNNPDVTMNDFDSSTPFSEEDSEFTVNIPTSSATSSTGNISLTPTVLTGYGTNATIDVVATSNLSAASVVSTGVSLDVRNIADNATLTLRVKSASGNTTKDYKLNFKVFSIDTSISAFTVTNLNGVTSQRDEAQSSVDRYSFFLLQDANGNYGATMNITANNIGAKITVNGVEYQQSTRYDVNTYSVVVTAPAGNTHTYSVVLAKSVSDNELQELWFSNTATSADSADGFTNVFSENSDNSKYDSGSKTYTGKYAADARISIVHFRFVMPSGKSATVAGDMKQGQPVTINNETFTTYYMQLRDAQGGVATSGTFVGRIVVSGGNSSQTYTFNISVVEGKNTIEGIIVNNASNQAISGFSFNKDITTYTLSVPYATSMLNFRVTTDASFAAVRLSTNSSADSSVMQRNSYVHTATVQLREGLNTISLRAIADNDTGAQGTLYTLNITRNTASSDATLKSLSITAGGKELLDGSTDERTFSSSKETYLIIDASLSADSVFVRAEATDANATVTGTGTVQLQANAGGTMQVVSITVYAEDGVAVKTYNVNIAKEETNLNDANSVNNISIMVNGTNKMTGFYSDLYQYSFSVPYSVDRVYVEVSATTLNPNGIIGAGYKSLVQGINEITVQVVSQSGKYGHEYKITITRLEPRGNVNLDRLLIDGVAMTLKDDVYNYSITRSKNEERNIMISAFSQDVDALVTIQRGTISASGYYNASRDFRVERGETITVTITVSLDGNSNQYTLIVTRIADDASLSTLTVELNERGNFVPLLDRDLKPIDAFNPNVREYYLTIPFDTSSLIISATAVDETATIRGNGLRTVSTLFGSAPGKQSLQIAVIPLDGNIVLYSITVTRMAARTSATDAVINISQIADFADEYAADLNLYGEYKVGGTVSVLDFDIDFGGDDYTYIPTYKIFYNSELQDDGDGVYFDDITLDYGLNVVNIEITATDNITKRTIVILVTRVKDGILSAGIDQIEDFGTAFDNDDRDSDVRDYCYTVDNKVQKLDFNFKVEDGYTYVIDEKANALQEGLNDIVIKVYDKDGVESTIINLHVFREGKPTTSSTLLIVTVVISVIEAMLLAAAVVVVIMKTNSRNNTKKNNDAE